MRDFSVGNLITSYRARLGLKQHEVANPDDPELLSVALRTYQGWENGERIPSNKWLRRIASFFHLSDAEADELYRAAAQVAPEIDNLPFQRNPFFTGRETHLERLDQCLKENGSVALTQPISISGLGGIGKTQLALEYAHRNHHKVYRAVLWANAVDKAALEASYLSLARLLNLPEKDEREVDLIVQAVKTWLKEHTSWLLILDNADDLQLARSFLPTKPRGHILLTTCSQIVGNIAERIEVEAMEQEEALLFLLRRSGVLKDGTELDILASHIHNTARQLVEILGGHPLALDQAGAYIEETGASFVTYIQLYADQRLILLSERGSLGDEHPETVVVTFEISFQRACKLCSEVADVLHCCSFLLFDDIPEELFSNGLKLDIAKFNNAIRALRRYSLIKRNAEKKILSVHRLVQVVLRDAMTTSEQEVWTEKATIALNIVFPHVEYTTWSQCERLVSHVLACTAMLERQAALSPEGVELLNKTALYLLDRARYKEAEPLLQRVVATLQQSIPDHSNTAAGMYNLARTYYWQGRYAEAELLFLQARAIDEKALGEGHLNMAIHDHSLALLHKEQGRFKEAERLYRQALTVRERHLGREHRAVVEILGSLGKLYLEWGKFGDAEPLFLRAIELQVQHGGQEHPEAMTLLNDLADLYCLDSRDAAAEPLYQQILQFRVKQVGAIHPLTATAHLNMAKLYLRRGQYQKSEPYARRALEIYESTLGQTHPYTAAGLHCLAAVSYQQNDFQQAETYWQQAFTICEQQEGSEHPHTALCLHGLAMVSCQRGQYQEAETYWQRALAIQEPLLGFEHPDTIQILKSYTQLLRIMGRESDAKLLETRSLNGIEPPSTS
jgi:tetratricopeptide (TPR) repeat protein